MSDDNTQDYTLEATGMETYRETLAAIMRPPSAVTFSAVDALTLNIPVRNELYEVLCEAVPAPDPEM